MARARALAGSWHTSQNPLEQRMLHSHRVSPRQARASLEPRGAVTRRDRQSVRPSAQSATTRWLRRACVNGNGVRGPERTTVAPTAVTVFDGRLLRHSSPGVSRGRLTRTKAPRSDNDNGNQRLRRYKFLFRRHHIDTRLLFRDDHIDQVFCFGGLVTAGLKISTPTRPHQLGSSPCLDAAERGTNTCARARRASCDRPDLILRF